MMSSTTITCMSEMSRSRSFMNANDATRSVPDPYEDTAIQSISNLTVQGPGQVGHHHDRALEHTYQQNVAALVVGIDFLGQLAYPCGNASGVD